MTKALADLETPALIADRGRITGNAGRMRDKAADHGIELRPHLKTTKSAAIARIAHGGDIGPGTVSTLREAEYFLEHGFNDLTYAVCITPNKFEHAASLVERGADLKVLLADPGTAAAIVRFAENRGTTLSVMVEIDCGDHRTGLQPDEPAVQETAKILSDAAAVQFAGVLTHGGHSYACRSAADIADVAEQERRSLTAVAARLQDAGIATPVLSSGSTPTAALGNNFAGLTELRPGVYLAGDLFQWQLGTCDIADIAVTVLASVIAQDRRNNRLVLDAGGLALSKDRSTSAAPRDYGFGLLVQEDGSLFDSDLIVHAVSQEHGEVSSTAPLPFDTLPIGARVRVLPNHVCMTAASYDRYHVVDGGTGIVDEWHKAVGW